MKVVEIKGVTKRFGDIVAIVELSFAAECGSLSAVVGPSGCGKTTLLRLIAGLELPDDGSILLEGRPVSAPATYVPPNERDIGFAFQDFALWPHKTVAGHLHFVLRARGIPRRQRRTEVERLLYVMELADKRRAYPATLSGGQQQRLALARAFAGSPKLLLLDEPFASLDSRLRERLLQEVLERRNQGVTVVVAMHDLDESKWHVDALFEMSPEPKAS